ncbi:hypothetical protein [Aurantiacibacter gangjinensis]|uniref:Uncharacterized protein n=1 Tax=Aurantiacibacter gangjinensis TaxID=502682 RepID=A0A0G9MKY6_9SPHN|nr:hypothetical protein [Aurantiacibacter gangjinensis]APE27224.1 hypothetical protein BMF35_a0395 [Aurantiacibacter gangjinensis]KLE31347.1 hypothetical protein AAW01_06985 [Aurantiacibacter gangjinensis]
MSYLAIILIVLLGLMLTVQAKKRSDPRQQRIWRISGIICMVIALVIAVTDAVVDVLDHGESELAPRGIPVDADEP